MSYLLYLWSSKYTQGSTYHPSPVAKWSVKYLKSCNPTFPFEWLLVLRADVPSSRIVWRWYCLGNTLTAVRTPFWHSSSVIVFFWHICSCYTNTIWYGLDSRCHTLSAQNVLLLFQSWHCPAMNCWWERDVFTNPWFIVHTCIGLMAAKCTRPMEKPWDRDFHIFRSLQPSMNGMDMFHNVLVCNACNTRHWYCNWVLLCTFWCMCVCVCVWGLPLFLSFVSKVHWELIDRFIVQQELEQIGFATSQLSAYLGDKLKYSSTPQTLYTTSGTVGWHTLYCV